MKNITITIEVKEDVRDKLLEEELKGTDTRFDVSIYARFFDDSCIHWDKDRSVNLMFLKNQQNYANDLLKAKGYLFLNDVYDMLGIPRTKEGQVVGWIYDVHNPIGDNFVDFDIYNDHNSEFINGYENNLLLDFNVDGCILDKI